MPVEVGNLVTEVTMLDKELPLSPRQLEAIAQEVARRLQQASADAQRREQSARFDTTLD